MEKNKMNNLPPVKNFKDIFAKTAPKNGPEIIEGVNDKELIFEVDGLKNKIVEISLKELKAFENHPFKLYTGKKLDEMVESIKENGVMTPLIVRKLADGKYEILSGHNRANAAKIADLFTVPCIVKNELTDAEAQIIVTDSNFIQRSISDMLPSELAKSLKMQLEACKLAKQKQTMIKDVENALKDSDGKGYGQGATMLHLQKSRDVIATNNGMNRETIRQYIRLNDLIMDILDEVDEGNIGLRAAVDISYLKENEQNMVYNCLMDNKFKVDMVKAEMLRSYSEKNKLIDAGVFGILSGRFLQKKKPEKVEKNVLKISYKKLTPYFEKDVDMKTMEEEIIKALEFYRKSKTE